MLRKYSGGTQNSWRDCQPGDFWFNIHTQELWHLHDDAPFGTAYPVARWWTLIDDPFEKFVTLTREEETHALDT